MPHYKIVPYQAGFEENHARIAAEAAKAWIYPRQVTASQIRESFSQNAYDPRTSLYCFKESLMVGFLLSRILEEKNSVKRAELTFPTVLPGYEEVRDLLFRRVQEALKRQGALRIFSSFGSVGPNSEEWAEKWGFSNKQDERATYKLNVDMMDLKEELPNVREFNPKRDLAGSVDLFKEFNLPEEAVRNFHLAIHNSKKTIAHLVISEEEKIVAHGAVTTNSIEPTIGMLNAVHATDSTNLELLLGHLAIKCKKQGIKTVYMHFTHLDVDSPVIAPYKALGFALAGSEAMYEKELK